MLAAVFVPMAFFGGSTGVIYRQFSVTIVSAMALSVLVALVLTPALCATMLKPVARGTTLAKGGFFGWFNRLFDRGQRALRGGGRGILLAGAGASCSSSPPWSALLACCSRRACRPPSCPTEDQGS